MNEAATQPAPTIPEILAAAKALAQVCDGAHERDGAGYNGCDSPVAKSILKSPKPTDRQIHCLWRMLKKYQGQLEARGFIYELLVPPPLPAAPVAGARTPFAPQQIVAKLLWADTQYGRRIVMGTSAYSPDITACIKKLSKRWFDKDGKNSAGIKNAWLIPDDVDAFTGLMGLLLEIQPPIKIELAADLESAMAEARTAKDKAYEGSRAETADLEVPTKLPPRPFQRAGIQWAIDRDGRALIADEPGLGKTLQALGFLVIKKEEALPALVICPANLRVNFVLETMKFTDLKCQIVAAKSSLKSIRKAGFTANEKPESGFDLTIINYDILSTETAKTWLKMLHKGDSIYAQENLVKCGRPAIELILKAMAKQPGLEISNRLNKVKMEIEALGDEARRMKEKRFHRCFVNDIPVEKFLEAGFRTLIADELHRCKEADAQCTMAVQEISRNVKNVLGLTGTPILNRPKEAWTQTNIVNPKVFPSFFDYAKRYCNAHQTRFGWDMSGSSNLEELDEKLRTSILIRRRKDQVLKELPPRIRITVPMLLDKNKEYEDATKDPIQKLKLLKKEREEWKEALSGLTEEERSKFISEHAETASKAQKIAGLVMDEIEAIKQAIVKAKFSECVKFILDLQESAGKIIVFMTHHEFIDRMVDELQKAKLSVGVIDGRVSAGKRHDVKTAFQDGDLQMLVCGIRAASEGLTLTASHTVVFCELEWDPNRHSQAESRVDRFGQSEQTTMYYLVGLGTLEQNIAAMIDSKREVVNSALGEGDRTVGEDGILDAILDGMFEE